MNYAVTVDYVTLTRRPQNFKLNVFVPYYMTAMRIVNE